MKREATGTLKATPPQPFSDAQLSYSRHECLCACTSLPVAECLDPTFVAASFHHHPQDRFYLSSFRYFLYPPPALRALCTLVTGSDDSSQQHLTQPATAQHSQRQTRY